MAGDVISEVISLAKLTQLLSREHLFQFCLLVEEQQLKDKYSAAFLIGLRNRCVKLHVHFTK
jgi:hypothetical protein